MLRQRPGGGHGPTSAHRFTDSGPETPVRRRVGPLRRTRGQSARTYRVHSSGNSGWSLNSNLRESLESLGKKIHTVKNS